MEDAILNLRQSGFINFGSMTLLVGGLALAGLLLYGLASGHELPFWPAVAVALVNLAGAGKLIYDVRLARMQKPGIPPATTAQTRSGQSDKSAGH